jgi:hypothetical protein
MVGSVWRVGEHTDFVPRMLTSEGFEIHMAHHVQTPGIEGRKDAPDFVRQRLRRILAAAGGPSDSCETRPEDGMSPSFEWAASGAMSLTGAIGGAPQLAAGPLASAARASGYAIASLSGRTLHATRDWPAMLGERAALAGLTRAGRASCGGQARLLETRDGWIAVQLPREDDWQLIPAWLETSNETTPFRPDETPQDGSMTGADPRWTRLANRLRTRSGSLLVERGRLMGLAVANARPVPELKASLFELEQQSELTRPRDGRPLRVLDLSTLWAGPLCTSILAECGHDVLKLEGPSRPDGARRGNAAFFDLMNAGKDGAALDLSAPPDRLLFESLLESADVVVESARPRGLAQLGYDASAWVQAHPGRLWISLTGYGRRQEWIAFGDDAAVEAGLAWPPQPAAATGHSEAPCFCADAIADPLTGLHAAALALVHLAAGRGGLLSLSLRDVAADCAQGGLEPDVRVEADEDGWAVVRDADRQRVLPPRARPVHGEAPPLQPLKASTRSRWFERKC